MKKIGFFLMAAFCLFLMSGLAAAAPRFSVASGAWNVTSTWSATSGGAPGASAPIAGDDATIEGGFTVTLTANAASTNVTVKNASTLDAVTFTLAVSSTFTLEAGSTFRQAGGVTAPPGATRVFDNASTFVYNGTQTSITGSFTFGNLTWSAGNSTPGGNLTINGNLTVTQNSLRGSTAAGTPTRTHSVAGNVLIDGATAILIGTNATAAGTGTWNVAGSVTTQNGGTLRGCNTGSIADGTFNIGGNLINNGIVEHGTGTGVFTITFNGGSAQSVTGNAITTLQNVGINNTAGVSSSTNLTLTGTLTFLQGIFTITGANTLTIGSAGSVSGASPTTFVNGNLRKNYSATGVKGFEVGTANGYSPVSVNITAGTFPTDFTVRAVQGPQPNIVSPASALQRYWKLAATGVTADLNFNYLDADVPPPPSTENSFVIFKWDGGFTMPGGSVNTGTNEASISGVSDATLLSDWTLAQPNAPTATDGTVSGTVVDTAGNPIAGAVIHLSGTQNRKFITDANGHYLFDKVETTGFYTVTPSRANYGFSPGSRSFSQLGNNTEATFTAVANGQTRNPLDTPEYFVRQHYLDFLGREPDEAGFNFWSDQILGCGNDAACVEHRTINVSAAYFLSGEFQQTGGLVDRLYRASYDRNPLYAEFMPDTANIARNLIVGRNGWEAVLAANKEAFIAGWVDRAAFRAAYDGLANDAYVSTLIANTGVSFTAAEREALVSGLDSNTLSRARVLEQIVSNGNFAQARFNEAFVMMEYFGYLRRDPDANGFQFWLNKLNQFDGNFERAEMVKAFINSGEYRARFHQ